MNRISHWIDGRVVEGNSGRSGVVFDPATGLQQASVDLASSAEVDLAVATALSAFPAWRATNLSRRAEVMFHMRELVDANRKEIATLLTKEHGKVLGDALGEVARGLDRVLRVLTDDRVSAEPHYRKVRRQRRKGLHHQVLRTDSNQA